MGFHIEKGKSQFIAEDTAKLKVAPGGPCVPTD